MENFLYEEGIDYERKEFVAEGGWVELHFDELKKSVLMRFLFN